MSEENKFESGRKKVEQYLNGEVAKLDMEEAFALVGNFDTLSQENTRVAELSLFMVAQTPELVENKELRNSVYEIALRDQEEGAARDISIVPELVRNSSDAEFITEVLNDKRVRDLETRKRPERSFADLFYRVCDRAKEKNNPAVSAELLNIAKDESLSDELRATACCSAACGSEKTQMEAFNTATSLKKADRVMTYLSYQRDLPPAVAHNVLDFSLEKCGANCAKKVTAYIAELAKEPELINKCLKAVDKKLEKGSAVKEGYDAEGYISSVCKSLYVNKALNPEQRDALKKTVESASKSSNLNQFSSMELKKLNSAIEKDARYSTVKQNPMLAQMMGRGGR